MKTKLDTIIESLSLNASHKAEVRALFERQRLSRQAKKPVHAGILGADTDERISFKTPWYDRVLTPDISKMSHHECRRYFLASIR
ncbi:hypothetical protein ACTUVN_002376 [Pseudomonas caspiana]